MALPDSAIDLAAWPSPTTITPLMGIPSICSHNAVSTFAENLIKMGWKMSLGIAEIYEETLFLKFHGLFSLDNTSNAQEFR